MDLTQLFWLGWPTARYTYSRNDSLAAMAAARSVSPAELFIETALETEGRGLFNYPLLNQTIEAVEEFLSHPRSVLGLADSGAHVGSIMDASQPTFFLSHWVRDTKRFALEEGVRRLTSEPADLFGLSRRGRIAVGALADLNVIDLDALALPVPEYVHDFPLAAGRYVQRASGYDATIVNGQLFMRGGEHTGALAGTTLRG
jgi:N-acyl-D-aspartate/D-glutamate deacylase